MLVYCESINSDYDPTGAMFWLKEKVGEGRDMVFLDRFKTFSYAEMAAEIEKIVKREVSNG